MTALSDLVTTLQGYTGINTDTAVVESWIRMAEEEFNNRLRYKDMIERRDALFTDNCVNLPADFLDIEFVRYKTVAGSDNEYIRGGKPFEYATVSEYWDRVNNTYHPSHNVPTFTIIGNSMFVSPPVNITLGTSIEFAAYFKIPPLGEDSNWLYDGHLSAYLYNSLKHSSGYLGDDMRLAVWQSMGNNIIDQMNERSKTMKYPSATPLRRKARSFG